MGKPCYIYNNSGVKGTIRNNVPSQVCFHTSWSVNTCDRLQFHQAAATGAVQNPILCDCTFCLPMSSHPGHSISLLIHFEQWAQTHLSRIHIILHIIKILFLKLTSQLFSKRSIVWFVKNLRMFLFFFYLIMFNQNVRLFSGVVCWTSLII